MNTHDSAVADLRGLATNPLFRKVMDSLSIGLSITDAEGTILFFSKAAYALNGLDEHTNVEGRPIEEIFPTTARNGVLKALRTRSVVRTSSVSLSGESALTNRYPLSDDADGLLGCFTEVIAGTAEKGRINELLHDIRLLHEKVDYYVEQEQTLPRLCTFDALIGESPAMQELKALGRRFAQTQEPVLVMGESGTGKELVAQALHQASPRGCGQFLTVNCAALPHELAESELFGYAEGAFTGSRRGGLKGKFELAHKGTIFLDEIGEIPLPIQAKLLRVLESREIQKIGSSKPVYADFRLIAATNRPLRDMVARGQFRADLYHRLSALELTIPPLRQRRDDLPLLIRHLLCEISGGAGREDVGISEPVLGLFRRYPWHGNVRELKNVLTYAWCCMDGREREIRVGHLPARFLRESTSDGDIPETVPQESMQASVANAERQIIEAALRRAKGRKTAAAADLGISRNKLYLKMRKLGIGG